MRPAERLFHRFPMLRVERVVRVVPGEEAEALLRVTGNDALLRGAPHLPALLLVEAMAQVAALFAEEGPRTESGTLAGLSDVSFGDPVPVGATVSVVTRRVGRYGHLLRAEGRAEVLGRHAASAQITIAL